MRLLCAALVAAVAACSFRLPEPDPAASDAPAVVDAPAVTPADAAPPVDMRPVDAPPGGLQHCSNQFIFGTRLVSIECDREDGTATCQCLSEGVLVRTCTSFSLAPCNLPTCCGGF